MKNIAKKVLLVIAILSLVMALASCSNSAKEPDVITKKPAKTTSTPEGVTTPDQITNPENDPVVKKEFCDELTAISVHTYSKIDLNIATTSNGITLYSNFIMTGSEVTYSIEKMATFKTDESGNIIIPDGVTEVRTGSIVLSGNGNEVIFDGEILPVPSYDVLVGDFYFDPENVGQYQREEEDSLKKVIFEIKDASAFFGTDVGDIQSIVATVWYTETAMTAISVEFTTSTSTVVFNYTFI